MYRLIVKLGVAIKNRRNNKKKLDKKTIIIK